MTTWFPNLIKAREKLGYTQREMADFLGHRSVSRYAMWEAGERQPRLQEAIRVAKVLGETVEYLFEAKQKQQ